MLSNVRFDSSCASASSQNTRARFVERVICSTGWWAIKMIMRGTVPGVICVALADPPEARTHADILCRRPHQGYPHCEGLSENAS